MGGITTTLFQRPRDPQFNNTTLLLSGNFPTNGAQNNTFLDSGTANSGSGFSITRNGNTTQGTFSPFSQAAGYWSNYFDGSSALSVSYLATNFGTGDFTVETFVFPTARTSSYTVLLDTRSGGTSNPFVFGLTGTNGYLYYYNGSVENASTTTVQLNTWSHIAISRSGSTVRLFVNGTQVLSVTDSSNLTGTSTGNVSIAQDAVAGSRLTGYLSNFRVVKGTAVYTSAFTVPTSPLTNITNTSLLTCQSNRFVDNGTANSGSGFTITVTGTPSVQAFSPFVPSGAYTTTAVGGSGYFDGTSDYLTAPSGASISGSGAFTCEFWYYMTVSQNDRYIMAGGTNTFSVGVSGNGNMFYGKSGVGNVYAGSGLPTAINQWVHVVVGKNSSGTYRIWANGASISTGSDSFTYTADTAYVGISSALTNPITGYITGLRTASVDIYGVSNTTITIPTAPQTNISNTLLLLNFTNAGIVDSTAKNVLETVGGAQISTTQSKFGGSSIYFDGTGDGLYFLTNMPFVSSGDFTVEGWFYTGSSSNQTLVSLNSSASTGYAAMRLDFEGSTGKLFLLCSANNSSWGVNVGTTSTISLSTWTYFAVVRSGSNFTVYINGTSGATATLSGALYAGTASYVGCNFTSGVLAQSVNGYLDDIRVTRFARYAANFNVPTIGFTDR